MQESDVFPLIIRPENLFFKSTEKSIYLKTQLDS